MEDKVPLFLGDDVPEGESLSSSRALTAVRFASLAEKRKDVLGFLSFREALRKANVILLNDDPSFESTLYRAYEAPLEDEERLRQLRIDLHALEKRLILPLLEEEIRAYSLLELRAFASREKRWEPLYEKVISEAKGGSFLGVTHKAILDAFFSDDWSTNPEASFYSLAARFLADESYDLTKKRILSPTEALRQLGGEPILSSLAAKDLLKRLYGPRATGDLYLAYDALFTAAGLARENPHGLDMEDLLSLYDFYYVASHSKEGYRYEPSSPRWRDFLHSEEMI